MSIIRTHFKETKRLPVALISVAEAGLQQLRRGLFPGIRKTDNTLVAPESFPSSHKCPECQTELGAAHEMYRRMAICDHCGYHFVWSAFKRVEHLTDPGSFKPIGHTLLPVDVLGFVDEQPYVVKLRENQEKTGLNDAILSGRCRIGGTETVLAVLDFHFMGGSMGSVVGEQITVAFEYATKHRLPVVTVVNSGGARMQEGIISLMQMPKTVAAVQRFHNAGLFYLSILASPTTGGVFASFASLGDVILAEPKALVGFAGPRVAEQATGQKLPSESHRAESVLTAGHLDAIITRHDLPYTVAKLLKATITHPKQYHSQNIHANELPPVVAHSSRKTAWETVSLARHPERPTARDYIRYLSPNFLALQGDRYSSDDPTMIVGLGDIAGRSAIFVGQERHRNVQTDQGEGGQTKHQPAGYRKALRMMELAARLRCPLVTFVDTAGADPGIESEKQGISGSLAHCLSTMSHLPVPIITIIIGEGASGGAVALAVADRILMLQHAIYEVISPEGAATILYRNVEKTGQVAEQLKLTAFDCLRLKVIDAIIPEPLAGAHTDPSTIMQTLQHYLLHAFTTLEQVPVKRLLARRYRKFRRHGQFQHKQLQSIRAFIRQDWQMTPLFKGKLSITAGLSALIVRGKLQEQDLASS